MGGAYGEELGTPGAALLTLVRGESTVQKPAWLRTIFRPLLVSSEDQLREVRREHVNALACPVVVLSADGTVKEVVGSWKCLGLDPDDWSGLPISQCLPPALAEPILDRVKTILERGRPLTFEQPVEELDREVRVSIHPIRVGEETEFVVIILDVTQQKRVLRQLIQERRIGQLSQRVGEITRKLGDHLAALRRGMVLSLTATGEERELIQRQLEEMLDRCSQLVERLDDLGGPASQRSRNFELVELVCQVADEFRRQHLKSPQAILRVSLPAGRLMVWGNPALFSEALLNLLENALQATADSTSPEIEVSLIKEQREGFAELMVRDNGRGMEEEELIRATEPFFTTRPGRAGLGLPLVEEVVRSMGGRLELRSLPSVGTTVHLHLPLVESLDHKQSEIPGQERPVSSGEVDVLLAEDNDSVRRSLSTFLRRRGFRVKEVSNGAEVIEQLARLETPPKVVIVDLVMPEMGGIDVVRMIRESYPQVQTVLTSGKMNSRDLREVMEGDYIFLSKPFLPSELARVVSQLMAKGS